MSMIVDMDVDMIANMTVEIRNVYSNVASTAKLVCFVHWSCLKQYVILSIACIVISPLFSFKSFEFVAQKRSQNIAHSLSCLGLAVILFKILYASSVRSSAMSFSIFGFFAGLTNCNSFLNNILFS